MLGSSSDKNRVGVLAYRRDGVADGFKTETIIRLLDNQAFDGLLIGE